MLYLRPEFAFSPVRQAMRTRRWSLSWQAPCPMIRMPCAATMGKAMYAAAMDTTKKAITAETAEATVIMAAEAITERDMKEAAAAVTERAVLPF